jgi:imidazolonepropionase-like amidohydrolase
VRPPPLEAINGATGAAVAAIGRADEFGPLRPGLRADLLLVRGIAANGVGCVANVEAVYLGGPPRDARLNCAPRPRYTGREWAHPERRAR